VVGNFIKRNLTETWEEYVSFPAPPQRLLEANLVPKLSKVLKLREKKFGEGDRTGAAFPTIHVTEWEPGRGDKGEVVFGGVNPGPIVNELPGVKGGDAEDWERGHFGKLRGAGSCAGKGCFSFGSWGGWHGFLWGRN